MRAGALDLEAAFSVMVLFRVAAGEAASDAREDSRVTLGLSIVGSWGAGSWQATLLGLNARQGISIRMRWALMVS